MAIPVTCPSCLKRFSVSDKFAGRTGPCPNCQKPIKISEKSEEVVIHAPDEAGPKDSTGKKILNPLRRKEVKLGMPVIVGAALATVVIFGIAFGLGLSGDQPHVAVLAISSILLAVPLVVIGYWFLQDDELEGFDGQQMMIRCGIVSMVFASLWGLYAFLPAYVLGYSSMAEFSGLEMAMVLPVMVAIGAVVSILALELEVVQGVLHYALYLVVTFLLAWLAGTHLAAPLSDGDPTGPTPPSVTTPGQAAEQPVAPEAPPASDSKPIPNLLQ